MRNLNNMKSNLQMNFFNVFDKIASSHRCESAIFIHTNANSSVDIIFWVFHTMVMANMFNRTFIAFVQVVADFASCRHLNFNFGGVWNWNALSLVIKSLKIESVIHSITSDARFIKECPKFSTFRKITITEMY